MGGHQRSEQRQSRYMGGGQGQIVAIEIVKHHIAALNKVEDDKFEKWKTEVAPGLAFHEQVLPERNRYHDFNLEKLKMGTPTRQFYKPQMARLPASTVSNGIFPKDPNYHALADILVQGIMTGNLTKLHPLAWAEQDDKSF